MEWKERLREDLDRLANDHVNRVDPEHRYDRRVTPAEQRVRRALRHIYFIPIDPHERLRAGEKYFASFLDAPVQKIAQEALRAAGRN